MTKLLSTLEYRLSGFAGMVARVESLPPSLRSGDLRRGRMFPSGIISHKGTMSEAERQVELLFQSLLAQSFREM
jgi:hypothetical protein